MIKLGGREYSQLIVLLYVCSNFLNRQRDREREKEAFLFRVIANRIATNFIYTLFGGNSKILRRTKRSKNGGWSCFLSPRRKFYLYLFPRKFLFSLPLILLPQCAHSCCSVRCYTEHSVKKRIEGQIGKKTPSTQFQSLCFHSAYTFLLLVLQTKQANCSSLISIKTAVKRKFAIRIYMHCVFEFVSGRCCCCCCRLYFFSYCSLLVVTNAQT